ncbi:MULTISPECIES: helix-turn-helix domain-containing protein [Caproicibacterium]|uniref:Helix-turn-helix transcriptional regulator n=1 Tax=Caproicibacterium argilliputei TaxID=3030016 RepID=A0AA97DDC9_9FIRM|nr:helix-turn-helix transcriptional regulator [Caproicibacterium argilliputei]WOC33428.1 helix-turn-helix transcriptional regulator [Caproicibacterium argilliputei]
MNRVRELRQEKGISQKELANMLQVQNSAISKYETGRVALSDQTIRKLTAIFDVSSDYLLGISNKRNESALKGQTLSPAQQELLNVVKDFSSEEIKKIQDFAKFVKTQRNE